MKNNEPLTFTYTGPMPVEAKPLPTYPPAESEWPEKLPAPEGCVWERQPMSGKYDSEEDYILLSNHIKNPVWEKIDTRDDVGWQGFVVFKAVPSLFKGDPSEWDAANESESVPAQYRELGEGQWEGESYTDDQGITWRNLGPKAVIQEGDFVKHTSRGYEEANGLIGQTLTDFPDYIARRRIQAPEPVVEADPEFPPRGSTIRVTVDNFYGRDLKVGETLKVMNVFRDTECFKTTDGAKFSFSDWRDGLELVTVDPVSGVTVPEEMLPLPVAPEGRKWVARGWGGLSGKNLYFVCYHKDDSEWLNPADLQSEASGSKDVFYLELVDEAPADERKAREGVIRRRSRGKIGGDFPGLKQGEEIRVREILTGKESL